MNKYRYLYLPSSIVGLICGMCFFSNAHADYFTHHRFYSGVDIGKLKTHFKNSYGSNFFAERIIDYNVYFGAECSGRFGFEIGIGKTPNRSKNVILSSGDRFPGTSAALESSQSQTWDSSIRVTSGYGGLNWYKALGSKLKLFALIGAEVSKFEITTTLASNNAAATSSPRNFNETKIIPIWKAGLHYNFAQCWGFRFQLTWRNYELLNPITSSSAPGEFKLENSATMYGGIFLQV